jgi:hypothetical protein
MDKVTQAYADSVWENFNDIIHDSIKCEMLEYNITLTFDVKYEHPEWGRARKSGSIYVSGRKRINKEH